MSKRPKVTGRQVRGEHTTFYEACDPLLKLLKGIPDIGISPGSIEIRKRKGSGRSIKFQYQEWGLLVQVTGSLYVQTISIRTGNQAYAKEVYEQIAPYLGRVYNRVTVP